MMKVLETAGRFPQQKIMQIYGEMPLVQAFALDPTWKSFCRFETIWWEGELFQIPRLHSGSLLCSSSSFVDRMMSWPGGLSWTSHFLMERLFSPECHTVHSVSPPALRYRFCSSNCSELEWKWKQGAAGGAFGSFQIGTYLPEHAFAGSPKHTECCARGSEQRSGQVKQSQLSESHWVLSFIHNCHCTISLKWLVTAEISIIFANWRHSEVSWLLCITQHLCST